jgi:hypothetical protein
MTEIEWEDELPRGTTKYPQMLEAIKAAQLDQPETRESWAKLNDFLSEGTARDLAWRLGKRYGEFDIIARKDGERTYVYARLKAGIE